MTQPRDIAQTSTGTGTGTGPAGISITTSPSGIDGPGDADVDDDIALARMNRHFAFGFPSQEGPSKTTYSNAMARQSGCRVRTLPVNSSGQGTLVDTGQLTRDLNAEN